MGGELKVKSTLDKGSVFWFELELVEVKGWAEKLNKPEKIIRGFVGQKQKIMVVDDRWENRSVLVNLLTPIGFNIIEATDGKDCLNKVIEFKPDCILIDLVMPVMDGFEATRRIRKTPVVKDAIVIGTSASVLSSEQQGGLEAGCDDFISKPIRSEELLECLKRHLNLEWIYDESEVSTVDSGEQNSDEKLAEPELIAPPNAEIAIFFDLAMSGDLGGIQEEANKLKRLSPKYLAFANHISELASNFEEEKILEFVQQYRGK